jgi:hypothetical protein
VHSLEVGYLPFWFAECNSLAVLNSANQLIALLFDNLPPRDPNLFHHRGTEVTENSKKKYLISP